MPYHRFDAIDQGMWTKSEICEVSEGEKGFVLWTGSGAKPLGQCVTEDP
jgi:hypothetical protein